MPLNLGGLAQVIVNARKSREAKAMQDLRMQMLQQQMEGAQFDRMLRQKQYEDTANWRKQQAEAAEFDRLLKAQQLSQNNQLRIRQAEQAAEDRKALAEYRQAMLKAREPEPQSMAEKLEEAIAGYKYNALQKYMNGLDDGVEAVQPGVTRGEGGEYIYDPGTSSQNELEILAGLMGGGGGRRRSSSGFGDLFGSGSSSKKQTPDIGINKVLSKGHDMGLSPEQNLEQAYELEKTISNYEKFKAQIEANESLTELAQRWASYPEKTSKGEQDFINQIILEFTEDQGRAPTQEEVAAIVENVKVVTSGHSLAREAEAIQATQAVPGEVLGEYFGEWAGNAVSPLTKSLSWAGEKLSGIPQGFVDLLLEKEPTGSRGLEQFGLKPATGLPRMQEGGRTPREVERIYELYGRSR